MEIIMPSLGETVDEGKVIKWHKNVGDEIKVGESIGFIFENEAELQKFDTKKYDKNKYDKKHRIMDKMPGAHFKQSVEKYVMKGLQKLNDKCTKLAGFDRIEFDGCLIVMNV